MEILYYSQHEIAKMFLFIEVFALTRPNLYSIINLELKEKAGQG